MKDGLAINYKGKIEISEVDGNFFFFMTPLQNFFFPWALTFIFDVILSGMLRL